MALVLVAAVSLLFMAAGLLRGRRLSRTVEDFISARGSAGTAVSTASLVATALGVWILFSPGETGTFGGVVALVGYGIGSAAPLLVFIPLGRRMRRLMPEGHSLTEYVWHRYGPATYAFALGVMVFYMFIFLTAELTGIALAARSVAGLPLWITAALIGGATLVYTAYGGLRSVLHTDFLQFLVLLPLLPILFAVALLALGGAGPVLDQIGVEAPQLLDPGHRLGYETGVALIVAILAANLFHQGYWQRVWSARDPAVLRRSLALAALLVIPLVFLAGFLGVVAQGFALVETPSVATFDLARQVLSPVATLALLLLAVALVTSSVDSLLNGLVSGFTSDLHRVGRRRAGRRLLPWARLLTVAVALPAIALATRGYSVLYLFLVADLVAAAVLVPVFLGLFAGRYRGPEAVGCGVAGLLLGALFFPRPDMASAWTSLPGAGSLMVSFLVAAGSSAGLALLAWGLRAARGGPAFDFERLRERVRSIQEDPPSRVHK